MNLHFKESLPAHFDGASRVWIYQSNRPFTAGESLEIEKTLQTFVQNWKTHGNPVRGFAHLFFSRFIVVMADETSFGVSGCSTDHSVRVIKEIEVQHGVNLFDRQLLAFLINDQVKLYPLSQLDEAIENNYIGPETFYFNNIVQTKQEWEDSWIIPVKNSWLGKKIGQAKAKMG